MAHPKYQQIADRLRGQIASGALEPGRRLPSEPDLATEYDASRNTVRLAIALLINQGLVVSRQGLGTFVVEPTKPFTALLSRTSTLPREQHASMALPVVSTQADDSEMVRLIVETGSASPSVAEKLDPLLLSQRPGQGHGPGTGRGDHAGQHRAADPAWLSTAGVRRRDRGADA
jgi:GntR family transcriptional regulator